MGRVWTPNQARAIAARERDICVAAGAGSGKTGVLVERFVRILRESRAETLPPEQRVGVGNILVITFTEKATREMKTRIVESLLAAGMHAERREIETAYLSTIHGFCARLLKENPFEAGVEPGFVPLDETQARRLFRTAFNMVLERAYQDRDTDIMELFAAAQNDRLLGSDLRDPLALLVNSVERVLGGLRSAGWRTEEIEAFHRRGIAETTAHALNPVRALLNPLLEEVAACREMLRAAGTGISGTLDLHRRTVLNLSESLETLPETVGWERVGTLLTALKETGEAALKGSRVRTSGLPLEERVRETMARLKACAEGAKSLYALAVEQEETASLLCHRFWGLTAAVWRAYTEAKRAQGVLDNDDLQSEAVALLENAPGVLQRYRRRFRTLMIDEFQDTSPLQMRLVNLLHGAAPDEAASLPDRETTAPNTLFVVGDVQQSIYGFRDADATIFQDIERTYRHGAQGDYVSLADNFRTRPEILQFVNRLFGQLWAGASVPFTPLEAGAHYAPKNTPCVEFLLTRDVARGGYVELEADALAARIRQMVEERELRVTDRDSPRYGQPLGYRDIAVLLRSLPDIEKYEKAFARRDVPYFVVGGGRGYYARREVRDMMNVLTVLDTPYDDIALAATLRSPLVGATMDTLYALSQQARSVAENVLKTPLYAAIPALLDSHVLPDDESDRLRRFVTMIEDLRAVEDRIPVGQLLERILTATEYDARVLVRPGGHRRLANVRKLVQMANGQSVHGVGDFIRRLREVEKLSDREGDAPTEEEAAEVVRLITVHKAKGLEFPVVFLADMARAQVYPARDVFLCDTKALALGCKIGDYKTAAYEAIARARETRERDEAMRLLYVALTRAKEYLVLCGSTPGRTRPFNWADAVLPVAGILNIPAASEIVEQMDGTRYRLTPMNVPGESSVQKENGRVNGVEPVGTSVSTKENP